MRNAVSLSLSLLVLGAAALGCTQTVADSSPESVGESTGELGLALPPPPPLLFTPVYDAYVGRGNCVNVGDWRARPTFSSLTGFCTYVWNGSGVAAYDDLKTALVARGANEKEIFADDTCALGVCDRPVAASTHYRDNGGAGSVACYRCIHAEVYMGALYVVLPPAMVRSGPSYFRVMLNGGSVIVQQPGNAVAFIAPIDNVRPLKQSFRADVLGSRKLHVRRRPAGGVVTARDGARVRTRETTSHACPLCSLRRFVRK